MMIRSYRDLEAWQLGMDFVVAVYSLTRRFPKEEIYGLTAQLRRAAVSVPSNISEGHRQGTNVYRNSVSIALGSLAEAETQLDLAARLRFASAEALAPAVKIATSLRQVLYGLRRSFGNS